MILIRKCNGICNIYAVFYILCCFSFTLVAQVTKRNVKDIDTVYICNLPSYISYANSYKEPIYNEHLSDSSSRLVKNAFKSQIPKKIISNNLLFSNSLEKDLCHKDLNYIIQEAEKIKKIKDFKRVIISDSLIKLLSSKKIKFLFVTFNSGFTRDPNAKFDVILLANLVRIIIPFGVITFDFTKSSNSSMTFLILDIENKNIAFYKKDSDELEPLKEKNLKIQSKFILLSSK
jgi:hypothetical protein